MTRSLRTVGKIPASVDDPRLKGFLESVRQRINAYEERIITLESYFDIEDWHVVGSAGEPGYQDTWVDYAAANISPTGFYKDSFGVVHIRGGIKDGTTDTVAFTLPEAYRSGYRMNFAVINNSGAFAYIRVEADGDVVPQTSNTDYVSLDGISFRVE